MEHLIQDYKPPKWTNLLKNIPKWKVQLAHPNTPIHRWYLPGVPKEFNLSIKRDDMTGSTLSGNKQYFLNKDGKEIEIISVSPFEESLKYLQVRKLEFLMADALSQNCKHVVTCGGLQSNHCRAVAVCARQLGLQPHLVLMTDIQDVEAVGCEGNLLLDRMCGAVIYLAPYPTVLKLRMDKISEHIKSTTGESCYHIPIGGSNSIGLFGYISMFEELISQGALDSFDDIVFACGSGGTAGGLAIANHLTGSKLKIHGVAVSYDARYFHHFCNEMIQDVGLNVRSEDILDIIDGHKGLGYGISTQEELDYIAEVSLSTGIMVDPVYTGKAIKGLVHELKTNPDMFNGNRILFLHTGGVFGLYDGRINATLKSKGIQTKDVKLWTNVENSPFV